jgi:hypothetical protein
MDMLGRLARSLGIGTITVSVGIAALLSTLVPHPSAVQAAAEPPLAGFWTSVQQTAPVTNLHSTLLPVLVNGEPSGRLLYVVAAYGQRGALGSQTVAVPPLAATPVTVSYRSATTCIGSGPICRPLPIPTTTTLSMVPVGASMRMTVTTRRLGAISTTTTEILIHPFG